MQARVYAASGSRFLLVKAPPASGKSRALMFVALEKLHSGQVKKVIVAVPERSIGKSFAPTELKKHGFHSDWAPMSRYNLCVPGADTGARKVKAFLDFLDDPSADILICTHATLRFAFDQAGADKFQNCMVGVDEFHHVSADYESRLGELVRGLMQLPNTHIMAMTGSYFRGDGTPVLMPEDEAKFYKVTYNYYEQLNGYKYLKSLGIGFHFYSGKYGNFDQYYKKIAYAELDKLIGKLKGVTKYKVLNTIDNLSNTKKKILERVIQVINSLEIENADFVIEAILKEFSEKQ